jgi:glycosyltransferase involved in cell wall biosynthesis
VLNPKLICIHIGARAHYLLPKALQENGNLCALITDTWIASHWMRKLFSLIPVTALKSLSGRYTSFIPSSAVYSFGIRFLLFELTLRLKHAYGWKSTLLRDQKFEHEALKIVKNIPKGDVLVGISYTSLQCFEYAKQKGMKTVLFQIDPGFEEEELVANLVLANPSATTWQRAPKSYWAQWKKECALADVIFVNSEWSKKAIIKHGVDSDKITVIALPYSIEKKHIEFKKEYPIVFTKERPLRCLFLGTLAVRKGIHLVIEAAKQMQDKPIEFIFVGRNEIVSNEFELPNIQYKGIVTRQETDLEYQQADVFLFPTFSDGFGLTQLEAMAWKIPVISTPFCGAVVDDGKNGWVMQHVDATVLISILQQILTEPLILEKYSTRCIERVHTFSLENFTEKLSEFVGEIGK